MKSIKQRIKRCGAIFLAGAMVAAALACAAGAAEEKPRVIRVGFPELEGFSETDAQGRHSGLVPDYLNEISNYTGWEYEYVATDNDKLIGDFLDGKFELMGGAYYAPGFEQYFAYPDYNTGYGKSALLARQEDDSIRSFDLRSLNGKTIGVYDRAEENIRRLKEFLAINGVDCTLKYYQAEQMSEDGNLYAYLESGEVDLLLGNGVEENESFRAAVLFDSQPYYIVTHVGNQELLDGLNMALAKIYEANPSFAEDCYTANFTKYDRVMSSDVQLSREEKSFVREKGSVTVAVPSSWHPMFCINSEDGSHNGIVPDILDKLSAYTGLQFTYVFGESYADTLRMVQEGEADMLGFFLGDADTAMEMGLSITKPYTALNRIMVRNKSVSYPASGLTGMILEGRQMPSEVRADEVRYFTNLTEALRAVDRGETDFVYGISAHLEQEIQKWHFANLVPVVLNDSRNDVRFAVKKPAETELFTLLEKAINSLSSEEINTILDQNTISIGGDSLSLMEMIYANPLLAVGMATVVVVLLAAVLLVTIRSRARAAVMRSELKRAAAESQAKSEFLSHMSHEIRTPMNAVMGLSDLTCMIEGVPGQVKENLSKIRASSRYLLSLINDILDMSRIDQEKMTIAREPFSLQQMMDELQSMMGVEAERRQLRFSISHQIPHSGYLGDAIRLRQVLTNLLSNAFKFTPAGGEVRLQVRPEHTDPDSAVLTFRVSDTGVGISPEDQRRIFEAFEQAGTNQSKSQGTGLGLPISRSIVRLMGSELELESKVGEGSAFHFTVKLSVGQVQEEPAPPETAGMLAGANILLVEDNDINAEIATELLKVQGAQVERAENGKAALERFKAGAAGEFQVILMDVQMPEMNGLEATRAIRALPRPDAAQIPIIAMTANTFKEDMDAAAAAGMNGFVSKPLDIHYLYSTLRRVLHRG